MKTLLPTTALVAAGLLAFGAAAHADPITVKGSYSLSQTANAGYNSSYAPTLTDQLSSPFTESLNLKSDHNADQLFHRGTEQLPELSGDDHRELHLHRPVRGNRQRHGQLQSQCLH